MKMKVWHIPQVPMQPFEVEVDSISEGRKLLEVLAKYDLFQFEHRIKPDYANMSGLVYLDADGEWIDVEEDDEGEVARLVEQGAKP